jgi:hypothetical protein
MHCRRIGWRCWLAGGLVSAGLLAVAAVNQPPAVVREGGSWRLGATPTAFPRKTYERWLLESGTGAPRVPPGC